MGRVEALCGLALVLLVALGGGCASAPPATWTERGEAALAAGDWATAQAHFAKAIEQDPRDGRAWQGQAGAQLAGADPEAALRSLGRLSRLDRLRFEGEARSTYADALDAAGEQRLARGHSEAALVAVRALAVLDPERRGLASLLGRTLVREAERRRLLGDREGALELYREACRVTPGSLEAWVATAEILLETRRRKEAMRVLEAARAHHPTAGEIRMLSLQMLKGR
jgi:tetratricopeptide (TPR) repeat protein